MSASAPGMKGHDEYGLDPEQYGRVKQLFDQGLEVDAIAKITGTPEDVIAKMKADKEDGEKAWRDANDLLVKGIDVADIEKATGIPASLIQQYIDNMSADGMPGAGELIGGMGQMMQYLGGLKDQAAEAAIDAADQAIEQIEEVEGWG